MARTTTLQDRIIIWELAEAGTPDPWIANAVGWKVPTVRKWRRRAQRQGRKGLASSMGRPVTGALSTFPALVRDTLRAWRIGHPGWGPKTLLTHLEDDERFKGRSLPALSSIARFLKEGEFTRSYERHSDLPQSEHQTACAPHEEWEMDARGHEYVPEVGVIALINLSDVYSTVKIQSYACWLGAKRMTRRPTTEDYQLVLRRAWTQWGLPDRLAVDRDSVLYDNSCKSPFPTRLHLWLLAMGVEVVFGRPGQPTDQATVERSHQTWDGQVLQGQSFDSWDGLQATLDQTLDFLNYRLPSRTLGDRPPLVAHPEALQPRRLYRPEWEGELLDLQHVYDYLAQGRWFRKASAVGTVSLGHHVYGLGRTWTEQSVEITFAPTDQHFAFRSANGAQTERLPAQGLNATALIGEMGPLVNLDAFQLALPFSWEEWRLIRLCETLGGMT